MIRRKIIFRRESLCFKGTKEGEIRGDKRRDCCRGRMRGGALEEVWEVEGGGVLEPSRAS